MMGDTALLGQLKGDMRAEDLRFMQNREEAMCAPDTMQR